MIPSKYQHLAGNPVWERHFERLTKMPAPTKPLLDETGFLDQPPGDVASAQLLVACHQHPYVRHTGLGVNAAHTARALSHEGISSAAVIVDDLTGLERVLASAPAVQVVVVQALWFAPEDFKALVGRWPAVQFVVRIHSQFAFLASDSRAGDVFRLSKSVRLAGNNLRFVRAMRELELECDYLPNLYPLGKPPKRKAKVLERLDLGLFGAARPQKHHATGAIAAAIVGRRLGLPVRLHINIGRNEGARWELVQAICAASGMDLVEHPWAPWAEFLAVAQTMDLGFQLSSSETFNYVTADLASHGIPSVVGEAIEWAPANYVAPIDDAVGAADVAIRALADPTAGPRWRAALASHQIDAVQTWRVWLRGQGVTLPTTGPGTILHRWLRAWGWVACAACLRDADEMDKLGPDNTLAHINIYVDRIKTRAPAIPRALIRTAIRRACRASVATG